jgi:hypothetical protein
MEQAGSGLGIFIGVLLGVVIITVLIAVRGKTFTYTEAMKYFKACQKRNPAIVKGSIIKTQSGRKYHIIQSCMDKNGEIIDGTKFTVTKLDAELSKLFEKSNVVIVE